MNPLKWPWWIQVLLFGLMCGGVLAASQVADCGGDINQTILEVLFE